MSAQVIFLFPGQSSRDAGMFARAREASAGRVPDPEARASRHAGRPIDREFGTNTDVQLGVLSVCLTYLELLAGEGIRPVASAGMSLGEYAHLVAIGALAPDAALTLVAARGRAYDAGPDGQMIAVQPVSADEAEEIIRKVRTEGGWSVNDLAISNDNSPRQCVVAGAADAVAAFADAAEEALFAQCTLIERRIPMHTGRFRPAAAALLPSLKSAPWQRPTQSYWPNVLAQPLAHPDPSDFVTMLTQHVSAPVLWRQTIDALNAAHPEAIFIEVGPRTVLHDMMTRRWIPKDRMIALDPYEDRAGFQQSLERLVAHAS